MELWYVIPLHMVKMNGNQIEGFEGFTLVFSQGYLKVYKQVR